MVFDTIKEVDTLVEILRHLPRSRNRVARVDDYLHSDPGPRSSGYRGVHLVYEYGASKKEYHGLRIELQIRTQLQHAWATAVETVDLFSGSELKYGKGNSEMLQFFVLVASLMAHDEGTNPVPGAGGPSEELVTELAQLEESVGVLERLNGYASIVDEHSTSDRRNTLTLELQRQQGQQGQLTVTVHETLARAEARLRELEELDDENLDAVLINIARISQLRDAYPNYFADTSRFTQFVKAQLSI